ncbi:MAG: type II toxin-antitoxin system PemK/MazF family toxin [Dehalococcoidia bacterium]
MFQARFEPVEGSEQGGIRPAVVVSHDSININSPVVIVVPLTSRQRERVLPTHVIIPVSEAAVDVESVAKCEQVRAITSARLLRQRGTLSATVMLEIDRGLRRAMALNPRP